MTPVEPERYTTSTPYLISLPSTSILTPPHRSNVTARRRARVVLLPAYSAEPPRDRPRRSNGSSSPQASRSDSCSPAATCSPIYTNAHLYPVSRRSRASMADWRVWRRLYSPSSMLRLPSNSEAPRPLHTQILPQLRRIVHTPLRESSTRPTPMSPTKAPRRLLRIPSRSRRLSTSPLVASLPPFRQQPAQHHQQPPAPLRPNQAPGVLLISLPLSTHTLVPKSHLRWPWS